ncbi:unnamed protein product, partial [Polarella glacialis]
MAEEGADGGGDGSADADAATGGSVSSSSSLDPHETNLGSFHEFAILEELTGRHGRFTKVSTLAEAIHGKVYKYRWTRDWLEVGDLDEIVVAKKMLSHKVRFNVGRERNEREAHRNPRSPTAPHPEDALTEIGVLSFLRRRPDLPVFLLRMLGSFADGEHTLLITEHIDGGELFAQVASGALDSTEDKVRLLMWQLLQATRYLHCHNIGHRDISLENTLITFRDSPEGQVRLMDFGQAVRTRSRCGSIFLRYFRAVGKPYYRGPECYVPPEREARIVAPPGAAPGRVVFERLRDASGSSSGYMCEVRLPDGVEPGKPCTAELFGYEVPPIDIFALGVCLFILAWRAPPWGRALVVDPSFAFIHARGEGGIPALLKHWQKSLFSEEAMLMLVKMVSPNPSLRPTAEECLAGA